MKRRSGINMSDVKVSNRSMILNQVKDSPKSRKDIAEKLHLTPAAITVLVNELMDEGCIRESGLVETSGRVGRKKVYIELDPSYRYAVGVNIEGKTMTIGIGNLKSEVLTFVTESIKNFSPDQVLNLCAESVDHLLKKLKINKDKVIGMGVGIVGKVDTKNGVSKHAYGIWDSPVEIAVMLEGQLGFPVVVENNVRALALAEMALTQHRKVSNMVFLKLGPGIGSAVILDKEIYKGANNDSGEIGHMMTNLEGKKCQCGLVGCLETVASVQCILEEIKEGYNGHNYKVLMALVEGDYNKLKERHLIEAYVLGDQDVIVMVNKLIRYLTVGVINSIKFYDPHKLVLYSEMFNHPLLYKRLMEEIGSHDIEGDLATRIESSHLDGPRCVGGIVLATKELFFNKGAIMD